MSPLRHVITYDRSMEAKGTNGTAIFDGQTLTIKRGFIGTQARGEKVIPLSAIGAVQLRKPSRMALMADGVWSVSVAGEVQSSTSARGVGKGRDARDDENSIIVKPGAQYESFQALTDAINRAKSAPSQPHAVAQGSSPHDAAIAQLRTLGSLHWDKRLSDEAFIAEVHKILQSL